MFRPGLLATLSALILTGCVSTYAYREGESGDYYYSEPQVEYYDAYGRPGWTIGYGYPGGWYGSFGYLYGDYLPYSRFGFPYGYYGGYYGYPYRPYYWTPHIPHHGHRPPHRPRPPGNTPPPGGRPDIGNRDREGGPWRHLNDLSRRRVAMPQPAIPGGQDEPPRQQDRPRRPPVPMSQPAQDGAAGGERPRRQIPMPQPSQPAPPRVESPRPASPPARMERPERESRRDPSL